MILKRDEMISESNGGDGRIRWWVCGVVLGGCSTGIWARSSLEAVEAWHGVMQHRGFSARRVAIDWVDVVCIFDFCRAWTDGH